MKNKQNPQSRKGLSNLPMLYELIIFPLYRGKIITSIVQADIVQLMPIRKL